MELERLRPGVLVVAALVGGLSFQLLLGTSYVAAFLDPLGSSTGLPVGVVNLDGGAAGDELVARLEAAQSPIAWVRYPDRAALEEALLEKDAYGGIVVSEDFSEALASFATPAPRAARVDLLSNPGASTSGNLIAERAVATVIASAEAEARERALAGANAGNLGAGILSLEQGRWLADPIDARQSAVNVVASDGANGLAPAYLAMACWVGGYLGSAALERFRPFTRLDAARRALVVAGAALGQAALALLALVVVGLRVDDPADLFLVLAAGTWMAYALVSLCLDLFGLAGVVPAFAILSLGLPASGALYPAQLLPPLYRALHAVDPFTWLVEALRTVLYAPQASDLGANLLALAAVAVASTLASLGLAALRERRALPRKSL